jgi:capsular polysaccharide biosynthesis protein
MTATRVPVEGTWQSFRLGGTSSSGEIGLFGYSEEDLREIQERAATLDVRLGAPPLEVFENLVYDPSHSCLYDRPGNRVPATAFRVGPEKFLHDDPESIRVPRRLQELDGPVVFVGNFIGHWGKFLIRCISRLWALDDEDSPLLGAKWQSADGSFERFLHHAQIDRERFLTPKQPTLLRNVIVPQPTFIPKAGHAYSAHFALPERIAERICGSTRTTDQPVYLSRSRLAAKQQWVSGEEVLEEMLRAEGVRIVHPEAMSFDEQVQMINEHETFIGCIGSAFHTLMFALPGRRPRTVVFEIRHESNAVNNFFTVDLLKGIRSSYVQLGASSDGGESHPSKRYQGRLDAQAAMAHVRALLS